MKNHIRTLFALMTVTLVVGCGQKGPLIIDSPSAASGEPTSREVTDNDSVLNTQSEEISPTR